MEMRGCCHSIRTNGDRIMYSRSQGSNRSRSGVFFVQSLHRHRCNSQSGGADGGGGLVYPGKPSNIWWRKNNEQLRSRAIIAGFSGIRGLPSLGGRNGRNRPLPPPASQAHMSIGIGKALRWWDKGLQPNMKEITSAQDLVESLANAGDKLVVVDFFSPGCGGCRALHPKICQIAEMNPDVQFLQVNYEEHKSMCYTLHVHVLPFFRFYRGAHGRLCSFSCTNATIKKFKDALLKHNTDRCSLGPTKGLEEEELLALSANKDLSFKYTQKEKQPIPSEEKVIALAAESPSACQHIAALDALAYPLPLPSSKPLTSSEEARDKALVSGQR